MDFIGELPKVQGIDNIMVVVDRSTKYAHFIPVSHPYTAKDITKVFVKEIVRLHGFPSTIVSDRECVSQHILVFRSLFEVYNRETAKAVAKVVLACVEYWYNTNYHASLKTTPFEELYGRVPPTLVRGDASLSAVEVVNRLTADRNEMLKEMQEQLLKA
ncbi:hypothetical protein A2U01_0005605 [Trifolium medium]|uniref:Integrase catalytic domain-containing protein n=1 Tax=Trifolium medium TaxID=97028 RepID=A0A392MCI4_9FABA|nr:hypothetical protein [Trifolium medium]